MSSKIDNMGMRKHRRVLTSIHITPDTTLKLSKPLWTASDKSSPETRRLAGKTGSVSSSRISGPAAWKS